MIFLIGHSFGHAQYSITKIVYYRDAAPGATTFYYFGVPSITPSGKIFFSGSVFNEGGGTINPYGGIWVGTPGNLSLYIREGDPAPGITGEVTLQYFLNLTLNDIGQLAFKASLEGSDVTLDNRHAIWVGLPGNFELVARTGTQAPGAASGFNFISFGKSGTDNTWLNSNGEVAFYTRLFDGTSQYQNGIWIGEPGNIQPLLVGNGLSISTPHINDVGEAAYLTDNYNSLARYIDFGTAGDIQTLAYQGQSAPGTDTNFSWLMGPIDFNNAHEVAFRAHLYDNDDDAMNDTGLWMGSMDNLQLVTRRKVPAPGISGATFQSCCKLRMNDHGMVVFKDFIWGEGIGSEFGNHEGIWAGSPGNLSLVARAGDQVPGATGDVKFDTFYNPVINNAGEVAFLAKLTGADVPNYGTFGTESLWAGTPGNITMIAMEGDLLEVNPGEWLPIKEIIFPDHTYVTGAPNRINRWGLSDAGQVLFMAKFEGAGTTMDKNGIFLASPTTPRIPTAFAASGQTLEATSSSGASVTLDGSGSLDPMGGTALTYNWSGPFGTSTGATPSVIVPLGTHAITLTVTATINGTTDSDTVSVTVQDTTPPYFPALANITAEATGPSGATVTFSVSATDTVDGTISATCTPASGSTFPIGTTTVTCNTSDVAGNSATPATFTVTVVDTTPPDVTAPPDITLEATGHLTDVTLGSATATDLVDGTLDVFPNNTGPFPVGETTVTWSATDAAGNTGTATQTVEITDTTPPILTMPSDMVVEANIALGATVTFSASATDIADPSPAVNCTPASGSDFPLGPTEVICTATDASGNTATGTFTVTVEDTTPPILSVPPDQTVEATSPLGAVVNFTVTATDIADPSPAVVSNPVSGSTFSLGSTTVTCTATDASGNTATGTFTVTVEDTTPPDITCPNSITVFLNTAYSSPVISNFLAGASSVDLVDQDVLITHNAPTSFDSVGEIIVTFTATDDYGNQSTCNSTISVIYNFGGFGAPVSLEKPFKLGRTIPVKFQLTDANGSYVSTAIANINLQLFSNNTPTGDPVEPESTSGADVGNTFRYDARDNQYIYNLSTKGLSIGMWQIQLTLDDGTVYTLFLSLK